MRAWIFLAFLLVGFEVWAQLAYHATFLLNPFNAAARGDLRGIVRSGMQLEGDHRVRQDLIFGRIFTAVAADGERRDLLGVRSAASVNARDGDEYRFVATSTATSCTVRVAGN